MRAAVLWQPGLPLTIEDVELEAPRAGELAVRVEAAGVCHLARAMPLARPSWSLAEFGEARGALDQRPPG